MKKENNEIKSTAHSKYRCQYHIVFAPKYRRKEIYGTLKKDIGEILRKLCEQKRCRDHRGRGVPGSHPYAIEYPATLKYITIYGISQGKKQSNDLRSACKFEIQIRIEKFLVPRVLCRYGRKEQESNCGIHKKPTRRRLCRRSDKYQGIHRPVYG